MSESCDTALAEYHLRQLELADAFAVMPGKHGQFFTDANVPYLGAILHHADRA